MPDPWGFVRTERAPQTRRPVDVRILDWGEVYTRPSASQVREQAGRCMDCGVPFCHSGCPLGNLIPEWNDLVWRDDWEEAAERLHATNNFPEFTGRLCPAPCEPACVLSISPLSGGPVTIKTVEQAIADRAHDEGWIRPLVPERLSGHTVAVIGSGPAGLAAAQQLTRAGHTVCVYERDDALGGLLRYGIPDFKMDKTLIDDRIAQMRAEGTIFRTGVDVGVDLPADKLRRRYDAIVLAGGALRGRDVPIPGRELTGIHQAMEYLAASNRVRNGTATSTPIDAAGKHVVIIGGGDTAADCLGTATRQGAASIVQLDIHPEPASDPHVSTPWPTWPLLFRSSPAHEEGGERRFAVTTTRFVPAETPPAGGPADAGAEHVAGAVGGLELAELLEADEYGRSRRDGRRGTPFVVRADLVLIAVGFAGPDHEDLLDALEVRRDDAGRVVRDSEYLTESPGIFAAGDVGRGASLVVWAIAEGRAVAAAVDRHLGGSGQLPEPVHADTQPLR